MYKYFKNLQEKAMMEHIDENKIAIFYNEIIGLLDKNKTTQAQYDLVKPAIIRNAIRMDRSPLDVVWAVIQ